MFLTVSSARPASSLAASSGLVPVGSVDLCVDGAVVVADGVNPVIGLGKHGSGWDGHGSLSPLKSLQLAELVPQVGVGGGQDLGDGGVPLDDSGLRTGAQVSITWNFSDRKQYLGS